MRILISSKIGKMSRRRQKIAIKRRLETAMADSVEPTATRFRIVRVLRRLGGAYYADVEIKAIKPIESIQFNLVIVPVEPFPIKLVIANHDKQQPPNQVEAHPV